MNRPGKEAYIRAGSQLEQVELDVNAVLSLLSQAWHTDDLLDANMTTDKAIEKVEGMIAKLESAKRAAQEMKADIAARTEMTSH